MSLFSNLATSSLSGDQRKSNWFKNNIFNNSNKSSNAPQLNMPAISNSSSLIVDSNDGMLDNVSQPNLLSRRIRIDTYTPSIEKMLTKCEVKKLENKLYLLKHALPIKKDNLHDVKELIEKLDWNEEHSYTKIKNAKIDYAHVKFLNAATRDFIYEKAKKDTFIRESYVSWAHVTLEYESIAEFGYYTSNEINVYGRNGALSAKNESALYSANRNKGALITLLKKGKNLPCDTPTVMQNLTKINEHYSMKNKKFEYEETTNNYTVSQHHASFIDWQQDIWQVDGNNFYITNLKDGQNRNVVVFIEEFMPVTLPPVQQADAERVRKAKEKLVDEQTSPNSITTTSTNNVEPNVTSNNTNDGTSEKATEGVVINTKEHKPNLVRVVYYLDRDTSILQLLHSKSKFKPHVFINADSDREIKFDDNNQLSDFFTIGKKFV